MRSKDLAEFGYPGYVVYEDGTVWDVERDKKVTASPQGESRHLSVKLRKANGGMRWVRVHKLVAQAFIPNPHGYKRVQHIDGDKSNNHVNNLRWTNSQMGYRKRLIIDALVRGKSVEEARDIVGATSTFVIEVFKEYENYINLQRQAYGVPPLRWTPEHGITSLPQHLL